MNCNRDQVCEKCLIAFLIVRTCLAAYNAQWLVSNVQAKNLVNTHPNIELTVGIITRNVITLGDRELWLFKLEYYKTPFHRRGHNCNQILLLIKNSLNFCIVWYYCRSLIWNSFTWNWNHKFKIEGRELAVIQWLGLRICL